MVEAHCRPQGERKLTRAGSVPWRAMSAMARVHGWRAVVLLLAGIALCAGLIGMHHVAIAEDGSASTATQSSMMGGVEHEDRQVPPTHDDHGSPVLHLCFAVLTAATVSAFLLVLSLGQPRVWVPGNTGRGDPGQPRSRAPPLATSRRLTVLCVMRN